ncbi:MAG: DUF4387 domain-containing protein [Spirochaetia bacterium]
MKHPLRDVAMVIRSKNAGPYELTLDVIFPGTAEYQACRDQKVINRKRIAAVYGLPAEEVQEPVYFDAARAVKVTMRRMLVSGSPGDRDVYGAQQHAPLLEFEIDV